MTYYYSEICIFEPTLCGFKSLVAQFYTICVYDTFFLAENVLFFRLEVLIAHVSVGLKVLIAHVLVGLDQARQEHVLLKP